MPLTDDPKEPARCSITRNRCHRDTNGGAVCGISPGMIWYREYQPKAFSSKVALSNLPIELLCDAIGRDQPKPPHPSIPYQSRGLIPPAHDVVGCRRYIVVGTP